MTKSEIKAYQKRYYRAHRERLRAYHAQHYQAQKDRRNRQNAELKQKNRERYGPSQAWIGPALREAGISNRRMAELLGVSPSTVQQHKNGSLRAPASRIREILRLEDRVLEILGLGGETYAEDPV